MEWNGTNLFRYEGLKVQLNLSSGIELVYGV